MKISTIIIIGSLLLITGCNDNIGFSKNTSSSNRGDGDGDFNGGDDSHDDSSPSDGIDGSFNPNPRHRVVREQRTLLNISHPKTKVDILFIVDNSSSMNLEQTKIASRFSNFINQIKDLDWHIAITTTDPRPLSKSGNRYWSDGQLVPFSRGLYYLSSSMNMRTVQSLFSRHIQRDETGSDVEMGIYTTYRTLERGAFGNTEIDYHIGQFIRRDADLAVVVVSDEDESPIGEFDCSKGCPGSTYHRKSNPDNLIRYVDRLFGSQKVFQVHSIITHTKACFDGQGHTYGRKYQELSMKTGGGIVGNICSDNYSSILSRIGRKVLNLNKTYKLNCEPLDVDKNGIVDMKVTGNPLTTIPGYFVEGRYVTFDRPLEEGHYQLAYHCFR